MQVTPPAARRNRLASAVTAAILAGFVFLWAWIGRTREATGWAVWSLAALAVGVAAYLLFTRKYRRRSRVVRLPFPERWREILQARVAFYRMLDADERRGFERRVQVFLDEIRITGIETEVDDEIRLLVAASAIIPIFGFEEWEYDNLAEVLVYPSLFDRDKRIEGAGRSISGMVHGGGALNRIMILSKPDLLQGFRNPTDRHNVGIHEFAHLIDGADGSMDGIPAAACPDCVKPWIEIMRVELQRLAAGDSVLRRYGLTSEAEFFAVAAEVFFERPRLLAAKHPELYALLRRVFAQDLRSRITGTLRSMLRPYPRKIGRNRKCPCGSGKKFKRCCLKRA